MRLRSLFLPLVALTPCAFFSFFACGGQVAVPSSTTTATTTATTTTTTTTTATTTTTTTTPPSCPHTDETLTIRQITPDGSATECTPNPGVTQLNFQARVVGATQNSLELDQCAPNADCTPELVKIDVDTTSGIDLSHIPAQSFVRVALSFNRNFFCTQSIEVTHLGSWGGVSDQTGDPDGLLYAAAGDGGIVYDDVMRLKLVPLGCGTASSCSSNPADSFAIQFSTLISPTLVVNMGETKTMDVLIDEIGDTATYAARDLRSYNDGACDDDSHYGWWFVLQGETHRH